MEQGKWLVSPFKKLQLKEGKFSWEEIIEITEISDEEIEKVMQPMIGMHSFYKGGFIEGAKWYREQLKCKGNDSKSKN